MRSSLSRVAATIVAALLVVACASATSPTPLTSPPPSGPPADATLPSPTTPPPTAAALPARASITAISTGGSHTCALTSGGAVRCWGNNDSGELGTGTTTDSSVPVDVAGLGSGVSAIAAGGLHTCALTSGGGAKCWGRNVEGQLGNGSTTDSSIPVEAAGLAGRISAISAGTLHSCAVTTGGGVKCWGSNEYGQLGTGTTTDSSVPVDVSGLASGVSAIAAGVYHTCALTSGGGVKCWGYGQSADATVFNSSVPVDVSGLESGVSTIAASYDHSCALTAGGGVKCWGANYNGQLGNGTNSASNVPVDVSGLRSGVRAISAGFGYICALTSGGGVKCWGVSNGGEVGDVAGLASGVTAIAAGGRHACAVMGKGRVKCWGDNSDGQLGNGRPCSSWSSSSDPVDVDFTTPESGSEPTGAPIGRIDHATGPTDVVLRFDAGPDVAVGELEGQLFQPGPEFTLYGDGTVIFRNEGAPLPPAEGPIVRAQPFRIAHLDEDQVQAVLRFAIGEGGLGAACDLYGTQDIDAFGSDVFTLRAGGLDRRVENQGSAPFAALYDYLAAFGRGDDLSTQVWVPERFWGNLLEAAHDVEVGVLPDPREAGFAPWPWPDIAPADFVGQGGRVLSADEAAVLGLSDDGGVVQRIYLLGLDGETIYYFSLWPMLPDETS